MTILDALEGYIENHLCVKLISLPAKLLNLLQFKKISSKTGLLDPHSSPQEQPSLRENCSCGELNIIRC
ncbi:hypothetical protein CCS41_14830 (plasmid) [Candidatus Fukatsuia symbiotica]|uniref:Uncharacterized protein n=1 Tax=Candidatus Fukatsuia symbiotica TaxID=1878942 RepID=A0A2U8I983_9GAMM|nr:hypothetical protein CCS41_14780 [Candidatus Fukatsuia symbiotica]AWK15677.1 hypothetical protein CCS41_14830 [Candidatus Fukatsuia symbiotica]